LYVLVSDIDKKLESFIFTGKLEETEFHVFSKEQEEAMVSAWTHLRFEVTYQRQKIDYMGYWITIKYLKVRNPTTGVSISLIPWFMIPGRPFPTFVYIYAIWHYNITGKKSLKNSADATGKLFKIDTFNKSTVSRNIKALENFVDVSKIDIPLNAEPSKMPPTLPVRQSIKGTINHVAKILKDCPSIKSLERIYGETIKRLPMPIRPTVDRILSNIPDGLSTIIKLRNLVKVKTRDTRLRPPRARAARRVQRRSDFADSAEIESTRVSFIEICRHLVMDATEKYHRFLF
jgi:hypothetical protein